MMAPLDRWLQYDGRSFLAQQITDMTRKEHHIFQPNRLQTLYREHTTGQRNHGLKDTGVISPLVSTSHLKILMGKRDV